MKHTLVKLSPRAALFIGAALLSTPAAYAQDTQVTPPPLVSTVPAPAPAPAPAPTITIAPQSPVVQAVPETPPPAAAAPSRAAPRAAARPATPTRQVTRSTTTTTTAPAAAPAPEAPAPVAQAPAPVTEPAITTPPVEAPVAETATTETTASTPAPIWPWLLVGALIVAGAVLALLLRRRTEDEEVYEEVYEPVAVAPVKREPVAPVVAEKPMRVAKPRHEPEIAPALAAAALGDTIDNEPDPNFGEPVAEAELAEAEKEDLAGLTAKAPVKKRPWLEFGMRPVRAGTSSDEALVEIELTVGNAGDLDAKDVRISTFLLADGDASHMEELLVERSNDTTVPPVTIKPGEGTRVDATLAVRKDTLSEHEFSPLVVADARYTMADGTEGRTSATFRVGLWGESAKLEPITFDRPEMHREVAAELVGKPAHA